MAENYALNQLLSERSRLVIMAALAGAPEAVGFNELLKVSGLTKGNLSVHVRKLEEAGLVEVYKTFVERKPATSYRCTDSGRSELRRYLQEVERLLKSVK